MEWVWKTIEGSQGCVLVFPHNRRGRLWRLDATLQEYGIIANTLLMLEHQLAPLPQWLVLFSCSVLMALFPFIFTIESCYNSYYAGPRHHNTVYVHLHLLHSVYIICQKNL